MPLPEKLAETVSLFEFMEDRSARIEALISIADRFQRVPTEVASPPYPEEHRIQECESQAYVWAVPRPDGRLDFYFAVENPQGISAMATCVILNESLSGAPLEEILEVPADIIYKFFGRELSMGKSMGLTGIINRVRALTKRQLASPRASQSTD